jgi:hypothetical protein
MVITPAGPRAANCLTVDTEPLCKVRYSFADPDQIIDISVTANIGKFCTQAAIWTSTLVAGAAAGAYFQPAMKLIATLY